MGSGGQRWGGVVRWGGVGWGRVGVCVCVCVCVCVAKPVAVELRCHATALISNGTADLVYKYTDQSVNRKWTKINLY